MRIEVPVEAVGQRLDRFLTSEMSQITRSAVRRLIEDGRVTVAGRTASKPGVLLSWGMPIEVRLPPPEAAPEAGAPVALEVIHEDDDLLVLDKPAGLVVHPGHGRRTGTLVQALVARGTALASTGGPDRPGIVHRLDQGTSGVLVVAKTDRAHASLCAAFAARTVFKEYVALVWGHLEPRAGSITSTIGRSRTNRVKMAVGGRAGRAAVTRYSTREELPGFALLDVRPETGRTHQIRVHMQSLHHPVVGDARYGGRPYRGIQDACKRRALQELDRLALHAHRLSLDHPVSGRRLVFESPIPAELQALLAVLRAPVP